MNWIGLGMLALLTLASWWAPYLMRRDLLFGATVPPDFRDTPDARRIIRRYQTRVILVGIALINLQIFLWSMKVNMGVLWPSGLLLFCLASAVAFAKAHHSIRAHAIPASGIREAELLPAARKGAEDPLTLLTGPLILAAGFLLAFLIPDSTGQVPFLAGWAAIVSRWNAVNALVAKPFGFAVGACAGTLVGILVFRFGTRRNPAGITNYRRVMLRNMVLFNVAFAAFGAWVVNMGAFGRVVDKIEQRVALASIIAALAVHIAYIMILRRRENTNLVSVVGHSLGDRTPDEAWRWGMLYYNPDDPALLVEKRTGPGYTVNFGQVPAWLMVAGFLIVMVLPFVLK
jgi:uncharacterized membrane protein